MSAWVYVLQCRDGSFYTGWTNDLEKRVRTHQMGRGGKYTRSRLPVKLAKAWKKKNRKEAMSAEVLFKQLKNRLGDVGMNRKFVVGLDKSKMKFYDVSDTAQKSLVHVNGETGKVSSFDDDLDDSEIAPFAPNEKFRKKFDGWG